MTMRKFKFPTLIIMLSVLVVGCKKYEEGPVISLLPKKDRVANTWVVNKAIENDTDVTDEYDQYELYLTRDGDAELDAHYTAFGIEYTVSTDGTWMFTQNDENIEFEFQDDSQDSEYQILKLTETEMWLREVGQDLELRLDQM